MCASLIHVFSGYGLFGLAAQLGVCYFDRLEKVIDYSATCRVLELMWIAVRTAINLYLKTKNETLNDILTSDNKVLRVWHLFFIWAGLWMSHKLGIRYGNFQMQHMNLIAFAPLFPVAGHYNYAESVTYFLSYIGRNQRLQK